jgi:hypothetical protein
LKNIEEAIKKTRVKHFFVRPDKNVQKKIYRNIFKFSGDFCGACDIGTKAAILKTAHKYKVPMILYGTSPLEEDSFVPDSIQDIARFKYILSKTGELNRKEINQYLIYPNLNLFKMSFFKFTGRTGKEISPLFYIKNPGDKEMGDIISTELGWQPDLTREYSKHFDCIAEPLTNYIRQKIYGYERRICQYSNMIRRKEIDREKAMKMYIADKVDVLPENYIDILNYLEISDKELSDALNISPLKYEKHCSKINKLYITLLKP